MKFKKILTSALVTCSVLACSTSAFAAEPTNIAPADLTPTTGIQQEIAPRISWSGTANLSTSVFNNVTSSNNVFPDSPNVTSNSSNASKVTLRVVDDTGKQIGKDKTVEPGKTVTLDRIPAMSGTYTIKAMAKEGGEYTFSIT